MRCRAWLGVHFVYGWIPGKAGVVAMSSLVSSGAGYRHGANCGKCVCDPSHWLWWGVESEIMMQTILKERA